VLQTFSSSGCPQTPSMKPTCSIIDHTFFLISGVILVRKLFKRLIGLPLKQYYMNEQKTNTVFSVYNNTCDNILLKPLSTPAFDLNIFRTISPKINSKYVKRPITLDDF
jgi:hypothetical protein